MNELKKNNVPASNQLREEKIVKLGDDNGNGLRVLFAGNSITMHGYREEIGWYSDNYGMAASKEENDYVHCAMRMIREEHPDAAYCIAQVAGWEIKYKDGRDFFEKLKRARDFDCDVLVMRCVENCPAKDIDEEIFIREYSTLIDFLRRKNSTRVLLTTSFWHHPLDNAIREVGKKNGYPVIELGDLGEDVKMKAHGLFWHEGVANHPGDLGMQTIAERIVNKMKEILQ